jgi:hypothetical protein
MSTFDKHPSLKLMEAFKGYQGQEPGAAQYLFMGLDANFSENIEKEPIFPEVLEYLSDGVRYWKEKRRHHPFLSPIYGKGSGYRYHYQFSKIGLTPDFADKISFVEVLSCPTIGKTVEERFLKLLDVEYLKRLDSLIGSTANTKEIFIARGAYAHLFEIGKSFGCFSWLPEPQRFELNKLYSMNIRDNLRVHVVTHFSDSISNAHLNAIRSSIMEEAR